MRDKSILLITCMRMGKKKKNILKPHEISIQERERERKNSKMCYTRNEILGIRLFLRCVLAKLHVSTYKATVTTLTIIITRMTTMIILLTIVMPEA